MTENNTQLAEQLARKHLEYIKSGLWKDVYGTDEEIKVICEDYLLLLEKLETAKEGFRSIAEAYTRPLSEFAEAMISKLSND